jgi:hypothetical protein
MIELLGLLVLGAVSGAVGGAIATVISVGIVWVVLTIDRAARR